jgi:uncharacterized membrane protein
MPIRMPPAWGLEQLNQAFHAKPTVAPEDYWPNANSATQPTVQRIGWADIRYALSRGWEDFGNCRTDVVFLCILFPLIGLVLARAAVVAGLLPLLFPLASGFALLGPFAAIGLNEMSRRREMGLDVNWTSAFTVVHSPALGRILLLGAAMVLLFLVWVVLAQGIYNETLGPRPPVSMTQFIYDALNTSAGWTMIIVGIGVGFVLAVIALTVGVVSFPMLLDRNVSLETAVGTSVRAVAANPRMMALWGIIVAVGLVIGSIPALLGLIVVMPVLGHATWHLYRRLVRV